LMACGQTGHDEGSAGFSSELIASEKTWPADFYDVAEQGAVAKKVTSQAQFEAEWAYFGLEGEPPERQWDQEAVIFLGVIESGTCPYELKTLQFNEDQTKLVVHLQTDSAHQACTDDATSRTFVFDVDANKIAKVEWITIENFGGLTPTIKLQGAEPQEKTLEGLPGTQPPDAFIEIGEARYETKLGTYCWSGEKAGRCVDTLGPVELLKDKEPVQLEPGQIIRFVIEGEPKPNKVDLVQIHDHKHSTIKVTDFQFSAPQEKGVYYYSFGVWWMADNQVSLGDAFYNFVIEVG